jgi:hypothetical protein
MISILDMYSKVFHHRSTDRTESCIFCKSMRKHIYVLSEWDLVATRHRKKLNDYDMKEGLGLFP